MHKDRAEGQGMVPPLPCLPSWDSQGKEGRQSEDRVSPRGFCFSYLGAARSLLQALALSCCRRSSGTACGSCTEKATDTGPAGIDPVIACLWLD